MKCDYTLPSLVFGLALTAGCQGESAPPTFKVSGEVTLKGKPVPNGSVTFTPDGRKQNTGPTGIAVIKDGRYDTSVPGGKGVGPGPHIVQIDGFDGQRLICQHIVTIDFPAGDSTHDLKIPESSAIVPSAKTVAPP